MTAHELGRHLLTLADLPVIINGWGSSEGLGPFEVSDACESEEVTPYTFEGKPTLDGPRIPVVVLDHGETAVWKTPEHRF